MDTPNVKLILQSKPASGAADGPEWNEERLKHIIDLREKALNFARKRWADYIFVSDFYLNTASHIDNHRHRNPWDFDRCFPQGRKTVMKYY